MTQSESREKNETRIGVWGHAAVSIVASCGTSLLIDPYESGGLGGAINFDPIDVHHDFVTATHDHTDHAGFSAVSATARIDRGEELAGPFRIRRTSVDHDEYGGRRYGGQVDVLEIQIESWTILHLSDLGSAPSESLLRRHQGADVAFVPVGGKFTIGAAQAVETCRLLRPRVAIPIHAADPCCELPLRSVQTFLEFAIEYSEAAISFISVREAVKALPFLSLPPAKSARGPGRSTEPA